MVWCLTAERWCSERERMRSNTRTTLESRCPGRCLQSELQASPRWTLCTVRSALTVPQLFSPPTITLRELPCGCANHQVPPTNTMPVQAVVESNSHVMRSKKVTSESLLLSRLCPKWPRFYLKLRMRWRRRSRSLNWVCWVRRTDGLTRLSTELPLTLSVPQLLTKLTTKMLTWAEQSHSPNLIDTDWEE